MPDDRHIQIGGDAAGNTVITGDGNVVIIQTTRLLELDDPPASPCHWTESLPGARSVHGERGGPFFWP